MTNRRNTTQPAHDTPAPPVLDTRPRRCVRYVVDGVVVQLWQPVETV